MIESLKTCAFAQTDFIDLRDSRAGSGDVMIGYFWTTKFVKSFQEDAELGSGLE
jgi:hypothetical protein